MQMSINVFFFSEYHRYFVSKYISMALFSESLRLALRMPLYVNEHHCFFFSGYHRYFVSKYISMALFSESLRLGLL